MDVAFRPRFEVVSHYTIGPDVAATRYADGLEQIRIPLTCAVTTESMDIGSAAARRASDAALNPSPGVLSRRPFEGSRKWACWQAYS